LEVASAGRPGLAPGRCGLSSLHGLLGPSQAFLPHDASDTLSLTALGILARLTAALHTGRLPLATPPVGTRHPPTHSEPSPGPCPRPCDRASFSLQSCSCSSSEHGAVPTALRRLWVAMRYLGPPTDICEAPPASVAAGLGQALTPSVMGQDGSCAAASGDSAAPQPCKSQVRSSQVKSGQVESSQAKSDQVRPSQVKASSQVKYRLRLCLAHSVCLSPHAHAHQTDNRQLSPRAHARHTGTH